MAGRSYSDEDKAAALAALAANAGNLARTAGQLGIPRKTLERWKKGQGGCPPPAPLAQPLAQPPAPPAPPKNGGVAQALPGATDALAGRFQALAEKLVGVAERGADRLSAKDAVIAAGVAVDKSRLLRGEPTAITDLRPDLSRLTDEQLDQLERLAALARGD